MTTHDHGKSGRARYNHGGYRFSRKGQQVSIVQIVSQNNLLLLFGLSDNVNILRTGKTYIAYMSILMSLTDQ